MHVADRGRDRLHALATAVLVALSSLVACRSVPARGGPPIDRSQPIAPADLFPDDLDFVVRIDAARVRQNPMLVGIVRDVAKVSGGDLLESLRSSFDEAAAVWVGGRWMSDGFHGDGVLAIEASPGSRENAAVPSAQVDGVETHRTASDVAFHRVAGPRPDLDVFERRASSRGEAVLKVVIRGRGVVLATAAEADAVLRVMRAGPDEARLDPPARGLISFAGRQRGAPLSIAPRAGTALRELAEGLVGYAGSLEAGDAVEVDASLGYASATQAALALSRAKGAAKRLAALGGKAGTMADSIKLTGIGDSIRVQAEVPFAWLAELH